MSAYLTHWISQVYQGIIIFSIYLTASGPTCSKWDPPCAVGSSLGAVGSLVAVHGLSCPKPMGS